MGRKIYWLALLPFVGMLVGIFIANRVEPMILGLPFDIFWVSLWVVLIAVVMYIIYKFDPENRKEDV